MKRSNRLLFVGAIALAVIIIITLIAAPSNSRLNSGSTYSRAPDGYGAWYAFMQQRGSAVERWQKPFKELLKQERPITLLRVNSTLMSESSLEISEADWIKQGNTLVILGIRQSVTQAAFTTIIQELKVDTTRRRKLINDENKLLGDTFGAVVWQQKLGKGRIIFSTTPYLAANAYQNYLSNYTYLADLVSQYNHVVLVDEYIHGYKDADVRKSEAAGDWLTYLGQTPILPALLQVGIVLVVLVWAQNRRFGQPVGLDAANIDNSEAYIQALATVLQKAESSEFVLEMVGKAEQLQLQKALGLGNTLLEPQTLVNAWVQQTGKPPAQLQQVLRWRSSKRRLSDKDLLIWLGKWQNIRSFL